MNDLEKIKRNGTILGLGIVVVFGIAGAIVTVKQQMEIRKNDKELKDALRKNVELWKIFKEKY